MVARTVTIFPTRSRDGAALGDAASVIARECGYRVRIDPAPSPSAVAVAAWGDGAVVFDATIDLPADHNYRAATYALLHNPYCILLSRSYLPTNFRGHLEPIAPPYPERWTNTELLDSLRRRLLDLAPRFPRPATTRTVSGLPELIGDAQEIVQQKRRDSFDVFLSYRGTHTGTAHRIAEDARQQHGQRVRIIRTDDFSYADEVLSLQRRWQVLRAIFALLSAAHELWVLWSDDYLQSWWTQGELVSFANMDKYKQPALRVLGVSDDVAVPPAKRLVPRLTRRQRREIVKRFMLGNMPESIARIRRLADSRLARILLGLSSDEPLLDPSFTRDPMLECSRCAEPAVANQRLDVDGFLSGGFRSLQAVSPPALAVARATGVLYCPRCRAAYRITSGPPRFWWYPVRGEIGSGPGGTVLEESPLCRARLES